MKSLFLFVLLHQLALSFVSPTRDYSIALKNGCGNIEFDVNFMSPSIIIGEGARLIKNLTVIDSMELNNPMRLQLNGQAKQDVITIE